MIFPLEFSESNKIAAVNSLSTQLSDYFHLLESFHYLLDSLSPMLHNLCICFVLKHNPLLISYPKLPFEAFSQLNALWELHNLI